MEQCNGNLCKRIGYCDLGGYCKKVDPKIRKELLKTRHPSAIEVEKFIAKGSGANCQKS